MVREVSYKQNLGHIGTRLIVMGVRGHAMTMKRQKPKKLGEIWDTLADQILHHSVKILAGDFNMSLTQVPIEINKRGVFVTCAAWTPWWMANAAAVAEFARKSPPIGVDSCGIFMVDQAHNIEVSVQWDQLPSQF